MPGNSTMSARCRSVMSRTAPWYCMHACRPRKGALVLKAIEMALDQDEDQDEQDVSAETFPGGDSLGQDTPERGSFEQRRADALTDIAESYLANGPLHPLATATR